MWLKLKSAIKLAGGGAGVQPGSPLSAVWTFPSVIFTAMVIGWAAEASQYVLSQGMALAILAWLQTLPEYAVEAVIAWHGDVNLMTANFTGSLRLLVGLGWPLIYITAAISHRYKYKKPLKVIHLAPEHCVEVMGLFLPIIYFIVIYFKASLTVPDAIILFTLYIVYIMLLSRLPAEEEPPPEEQPLVPRRILAMKPTFRNMTIIAMFTGGATGLYFIVNPFLSSMLGVATVLGVSHFVFVQWVAPFLSEFPEKVTAFYWAKRITTAPMAVMNMVSSNINQWTMLAGMIPIVYSISFKRVMYVPFDEYHQMEILLTISQSLLGFIFLTDLRFRWYEAMGLFALWLAQFVMTHWREEITIVYLVWVLVEIMLVLARKRTMIAFPTFVKLLKEVNTGKIKRNKSTHKED